MLSQCLYLINMILTRGVKMLKDTLAEILNDIQNHKRNKDELRIMYTQERLQKSLSSYYDKLQKSSHYLAYNSYQDRRRTLNRLNEVDS